MNEEEAHALYHSVWSTSRDSNLTAAVLQAVATGRLAQAIRENTETVREEARRICDHLAATSNRK